MMLGTLTFKTWSKIQTLLAMSSGETFYVHDSVPGDPSAEAGLSNIARSPAIDPAVTRAYLVVKNLDSFKLFLRRLRLLENALSENALSENALSQKTPV